MSEMAEVLNTSSSKKFYSLQALRGFVAILILLHHLRAYELIVYGESTCFYWLPEILGQGVSYFFCLSGFLMIYSINNSPVTFLKKRFLRIYPTYFIAALIAIFFLTIAYSSFEMPNLLVSLTLFPVGPHVYPLNLEWTLIYEVFFYVICFCFTFKRIRKFFPFFLIAWAATIICAAIGFSMQSQMVPTYRNIFFSYYNLYFIIGAVCSYLFDFASKRRKVKTLLRHSQLYWLLAFVTAVLLYVLLRSNVFPIFVLFRGNYYVIAILIEAIVISISIHCIKNFTVSPNNVLVKVGDRSYGIYLIHARVLQSVFYLFYYHDIKMSWFVGITALLIAFLFSWYFGGFDLWLNRQLTELSRKRIDDFKFILKKSIATWIALLILLISSVAAVLADNIQGNSEQIALQFDNSLVSDVGYTCGYVESLSVNGNIVSMSGWSIDTTNKVVPEKIAAVYEGNAYYGQLKFYERRDTAEVFGCDNLNCGWQMTLDSEVLARNYTSIDVYMIDLNGKWVKLVNIVNG